MTSELGGMSVSHHAATWISVPASTAASRLADPAFVGGWALGSLALEATGDAGTYQGRSLYDGSETRIRIDPYPDVGLIDYHVGAGETFLQKISIRVVPGDCLGGDEETCLVALMAWRPEDVTPSAWHRTCAAHETEILLIKSQLEAEVETEGP